MLEDIKRLRAIAETGLLYCKNEYDHERYAELYDLSFKLLARISGHEIPALKSHLPLSKDYPTAKVDVRGILLSPSIKYCSSGKVLMGNGRCRADGVM